MFLAITPAGLAQALATAGQQDAVWCGSDAIDQESYERLPSPQPSRFDFPLGGDDGAETIAGTLPTIAEHHPGLPIWVETSATTDEPRP